MFENAASIEQLSAETRARLRSTQILTSLPQVVSELLQNSLDAGARQISIGVNCDEWSCWVTDDGSGIGKDGLAALGKGSEHGRYNTSKAYSMDSLGDVSTFGFRGEALASAADLACLEISSRTAKSKQSWSIILKGGDILYSGPSVRWRRESPGTTVYLQDVFYSLPIRRLSHPSPSKTVEMIRSEMECYALVFPQVAFSLQRAAIGRDGNVEKVTAIPRTSSSLTAFKHIFGRALVEHVDEINSQSGEIRLEGFISLNGALCKSYQFIYINHHPISLCDIHRAIDARFASSSFGKHAFDEEGATDARPHVRRSPRKSEKKPVYVLNLVIPTRLIDNCLEPAKSSVELENKNAVIAFLSSEIQSFLVRNGFATHHLTTSNSVNLDGTPRKRRRLVIDEDETPRPVVESTYNLSMAPKDNPLYILPTEDSTQADTITWTDPNTGEVFVIDSRTGNSVSQAEASRASQPEEPSGRRTLTASLTSTLDTASVPQWIRKALMANNVYSLPDKRIPTCAHAVKPAAGSQTPGHWAPQNLDCSRTPHLSTVDSELTSLQFRKEDLPQARVISQVDRKFIACIMPAARGKPETPSVGNATPDESPEQALILVDQHAADERIRVEKFLKELCLNYLGADAGGVKLRVLSPTVLVLLTHHEARRLASSESVQEEFRRWGFEFSRLVGLSSGYDPEVGADAATGSGYTQVEVQSIPDMVADKLLQGHELRDLIKAFLAQLNGESSRGTPNDVQDSSQGNHAWLKALRWCPRELVELVNSKACRGAIMFNDTLTLAQCERLLRQLSQTVFPFQCAHGRPSIVPLTSVRKQIEICEARNRPDWQWKKFEEMEVTS
ncbi:DNA mismatch repair MutL/HexB family protein [Pleurotus pulmonarius]